MRAIAILFVIAAHFSVPGFNGGFIGVDIFFVISGYLITGILVRDRQATTF
jgi:peptidoglycan/LPS O-acetylase OafA/YrhL